MRRFVVIGQRASASADFLPQDLPGSSGRLDVLLRCLRAALLVSHGVRHDTIVYLVLNGGERAPRTLRFTGSAARFLRPDERSLAILTQKSLAATATGTGFSDVREGVAVADCGLEGVLGELGGCQCFVLEEGAGDVRAVSDFGPDPVFFIGDHLGFDAETESTLGRLGALAVSVGPLSLHAEDCVTLVANELDRRACQPGQTVVPSGA
ncbi:MAG: tRNA (pseudouridine(54)-N(1))-methyltransferase TrmY [Polyangiaceae bacterium]